METYAGVDSTTEDLRQPVETQPKERMAGDIPCQTSP